MAGSGPAVVLLHGLGEDGSIWEPVWTNLLPQYQLLVPDLPGIGQSGLLEEGSMDAYAAAVKAMLDAESIRHCTMLGHSLGGYIALAFAATFQEWLNGLGLVHSTALADSEERREGRRKFINFIETHGAAAFLKNTLPALFSPDFAAAQPQVIDALIEKSAVIPAAALTQFYNAMINRPDTTHLLANSPVPVLFIAGVHDTAVPVASLQQQFHLPPVAEVHILRHSGHMGMLEETARTNEAISHFVHFCNAEK